MASACTNVCRICLSIISPNHSVSIFSSKAIKEGLSTRLSDLLDVPVSSSDGLPLHVCDKCARRVERLEKAVEELHNFQHLAKDSYKTILHQAGSRGQLKRAKESAGTGVSPDTARARPPSKRQLARKQLNFEQDQPQVEVPPNVRLSTEDQSKVVFKGGSPTFLTVTEPLPLEECMRGSENCHLPQTYKISVSSSQKGNHAEYTVNESTVAVVRALSSGHLPSAAKAIIEYADLSDQVFRLILDRIDNECSVLCHRNFDSCTCFRKLDLDQLEAFQWKRFVDVLSTKAPTLLQLVSTIASHGDRRNKMKVNEAHHPGICMACAVLLKERNREMCGVQSILSLILYNSHAEKQVYSRLNHVNACLSYKATISLVEELSKRHTLPLKQWISSDLVIKFWGDNVDKKKGVRDVRSDHHGELMHMYSILAGCSRTPGSHLSHTGVVADLHSLSSEMFLPSVNDICAIRSNLIILVSRVLTQYIVDLQRFSKAIPSHILHKYSTEMAKKSEVIVVDVLMKNETKHSDMIDIMSKMQEYLGKDYPSDKPVLSGGDQVTCERQVGAQRHRMDGDSVNDRLGLLEPVTEDWHCLVCLLSVIWKTLYKQSSRDHGTLAYFRSLLNRNTVTTDPKKAVDANMEFLETVVKGHMLASACQVLGITKLDDRVQIPPYIYYGTPQVQQMYIYSLAKQVVEACTLIDFTNEVTDSEDCVHNYARVLCHYGALVMEFRDAVDQGNGKRVYCCWRVLLPHFLRSGRTKYSLEALRLQFQVKAILSPQLAHQVLWNRFVNVKGGLGQNIQMDLYNEHVVKQIKNIITCMGANLTEHALQRAARSVTVIHRVCQQFDKLSGVPVITSAHKTRSDANDIAKVTNVVIQNKLLQVEKGRRHRSFPNIHLNPLWNWDRDKAIQWIERKKKEFGKFRREIQDETEENESTESSDDQ